MVRKIKLPVIAFSLWPLFLGCAVLNLNHYHDGRTLGKGHATFGGGAGVAPSLIFEYDSSRSTLTEEYYDVVAGKSKTMLHIDANFGALEQLDVGFNVYSTLGFTGFKINTKAGLFPPNSALGIALFAEAGGGSSWGNEYGEEDDVEKHTGVNFGNYFFGLGVPISVHPTPWLGLYVHPKGAMSFNTAKPMEDSDITVHAQGFTKVVLYGGSAGVKFTPGKGGETSKAIILEGTFMQDDHFGWMPSAGVQIQTTLPKSTAQ